MAITGKMCKYSHEINTSERLFGGIGNGQRDDDLHHVIDDAESFGNVDVSP